jgi:GT2 family glycosyltransferase
MLEETAKAAKADQLVGDETVAVAIPTKNRSEELLRCLRSLTLQSRKPDRVIIIDQSKEPIAEQVSAVLGSIPVAYIYQPSLTGTSAARNRALDELKEDFVVFVDDDEVAEPEYISEILSTFRAIPSALGVSGVPTNYTKRPLSFRIWSAIWVRGPFYDDRQKHYWRAVQSNFDPVSVTRFGGGLMAFRSSAIGSVRFDEGLTGACIGEDVEFSSHFPKRSLWLTGKARILHLHSTVRPRQHWLIQEMSAMAYLYGRVWRHGIFNRLCFAWLRFGFTLTAALSALKARDRSILRDVWRAGKLDS